MIELRLVPSVFLWSHVFSQPTNKNVRFYHDLIIIENNISMSVDVNSVIGFLTLQTTKFLINLINANILD